jgi:murein DD-endopeptidase MepM/ murein hydrolase activator NlpD
VYAAADGIVIYAAWLGGYGNAIMVDNGLTEDGRRLVTLYGHGSSFVSQVGDRVTKGQEIMKMGSTGNSTGPHVHFEVREDNVPVDPKKYLSNVYVDVSDNNTTS